MCFGHSFLPSLLMSSLLKGLSITTKLTIHLTLACSLKHFPRCNSETWLFISLLCWWQLYLSFHPDDLTIAARISTCLADISCWMKDHHLQLNLAKTELLLVPTSIRVPSLHHNITFQLGSLTIAPSKTARNLGAMIDDQLNFSDHVAKTARSCRFALFNIKKIRPFLWERASQLLVRALVLSKLDYYNSLSTINPECVARLIFKSSVQIQGINVCLQNHHWLSSPLPKFTMCLLKFAFCKWMVHYCSSQRGTKSLSQTFSLTVPIWWNDLPNSIRAAESLPSSRNG